MKGFIKNKKKYEIAINEIPVAFESYYGTKVLGLSVIAFTKNEYSDVIYMPVKDYLDIAIERKKVRDKCVRALKRTIPTIRKNRRD